MVSFDVFTLGEAMLRLSVPPGARLEAAQSLEVHIAGAEANVAVALAGLGRTVSWASRLPEGPLGRRVAGELAQHGVDLSCVRFVPGARLGLVFAELGPPPRRVAVHYDRRASAVSEMAPDEVPWEVMGAARLVHLSGITPALSPSCRRLSEVLAARTKEGKALLSVDVNYRAKLWSPADARACLLGLVGGADLLVLSREDAADVFGLSGEPEATLRALVDITGVANGVLTLGAEGAVWRSPLGAGRVPGIPAVEIDRIGAGDALTAGVIDGLLDDDLERGVRFGVAMGAMAVATKGDQVSVSRGEVEELLQGRQRSVDR